MTELSPMAIRKVVLIAQLTVPTGTGFTFTLNAQGQLDQQLSATTAKTWCAKHSMTHAPLAAHTIASLCGRLWVTSVMPAWQARVWHLR